jgi:hypothetical protein
LIQWQAENGLLNVFLDGSFKLLTQRFKLPVYQYFLHPYGTLEVHIQVPTSSMIVAHASFMTRVGALLFHFIFRGIFISILALEYTEKSIHFIFY